MSKQEIENHQGDYGHGGHGSAAKLEGKEGDMEIEEQVHHEHVEEVSPELELLLKTDPLKGLSDDEVLRRRETFGKNELVEKKTHPLLKFLGYFTGAIAYLIEIAVICSAIVGVSLGTAFLCLSLLRKKREKHERTDVGVLC
jgi:H+-transporting ATPase